MKLFAELQANPQNLSVLRGLVAYYQSKGLKNEAEAFQSLIERKHGANSTNSNQEQ